VQRARIQRTAALAAVTFREMSTIQEGTTQRVREALKEQGLEEPGLEEPEELEEPARMVP